MNQGSDEKKLTAAKALAIAGFALVLVFAVWLAVQIVSLIPSAFSSLASLANSIYNYGHDQELIVATEKSMVNSGESFVISWTKLNDEGTYTFTYACADGVTVDVRTNGEIDTIACDTEVALGTETSLEVRATSQEERFVEISYTIAFTRAQEEEAQASARGAVTVVNAAIPTNGVASQDTEDEEEEQDATEDETESEDTSSDDTTPTYTPGTPTTVKKLIYSMPVSDPNGDVDLTVKFLGVGEIKGKTFVPKASIEAGDEGAIQFEIKNIGTKTADDWNYEAVLPSGIHYESKDQKDLKPNERAVITLGFEGIEDDGSEEVRVEVNADDDVKTSNNEFEADVRITD